MADVAPVHPGTYGTVVGAAWSFPGVLGSACRAPQVSRGGSTWQRSWRAWRRDALRMACGVRPKKVGCVWWTAWAWRSDPLVDQSTHPGARKFSLLKIDTHASSHVEIQANCWESQWFQFD